ncbi:hypothetical protein [Pseudomonas sp. PNPG3]|uniref:hypothetical protein n=1 Tax=Pseudomonas sp. PNPG3 TaxID=2919497 RepID=UPI001FFC696D|nr:hypothetical protein [Pseudomonas sp. PNPG3]MCK2121155.1 hypothetical protein [Pseudomonas sp. PNPG3]
MQGHFIGKVLTEASSLQGGLPDIFDNVPRQDQERILTFENGCAVVKLPLSLTEQRLVEGVIAKLEHNPDYREPTVKAAVDLLVVRLCKFLTSRIDASPTKGFYEYLAKPKKGNSLPHEYQLQFDLRDFLQSCYQNPLVEVPHIAAGRTDIYLPFHGFRLVIEVKRSTKAKWSCFSVRPHLRQASSYSASDIRLGVLATLDLSTRKPGTPHITQCFGAVHQKSKSGDLRTVIIMRVPGNRDTPSSLSA